MILALASILSFADDQKKQENLVPSEDLKLTDCIDKNLGYKIKCSRQWRLDTQPNGIVLLIHDEPNKLASLSINIHDETGLNFADLTPKALRRVFKYGDHFQMGKTKIGNKKAVVVLAQSEAFPDTQLLDYFMIQEGYLYRVSFSVNKKEFFEDFRNLFKEIIGGFEFLGSPQRFLSQQEGE